MDEMIREFTDDDIPKIEQLKHDEEDNSDFLKIMYSVSSIKKFGKKDFFKCYVAEYDNRIIGFVFGIALPTKTLFPEFIYVHPDFRRKGFGKKLSEALESGSGCTESIIYYKKELHNHYKKYGYTAGALEVAAKKLR